MNHNGRSTEVVTPSAGATMKRDNLGQTQLAVQAETASVAVAAAQEAMVKARVALAKHSPRTISVVRERILADCERYGFADTAIYSKPQGKKPVVQPNGSTKWEENFIEGLSVRFAEAMLRHMGNVFVDSMIVADDQDKRIIKVMAMDLETNATESSDVIISKLVERKADMNGNAPEGRVVRGERFNSFGKKVFIVEATEDELLNKTNAAMAKMRRNKILALCPADIIEEAKEKCRAVLDSFTQSNFPDLKAKMLAGFKAVGVSEAELEKWLGHAVVNITVKELDDLRKIHTGIRDGETSWAAVMEMRTADGVSSPTPTTVTAPPPPAQPSPAPSPAAPQTSAAPAPTSAPSQPTPQFEQVQVPAPPAAGPTMTAAELELEKALAAATKGAEVARLITRINTVPEGRKPFWREQFNKRMGELNGAAKPE